MCAALLTDQRVALSNVPSLVDVSTMGKLLRQMGVEVQRPADGQLTLRAAAISDPTASYELVKTMRASVLVLGPLLARCGRARVSLPGGCAIGLRPVDQHVKGLQAMGAKISVEHGYMHASAERLRGARVVMDLVTVTGTENLLMAAVLAEGETLLENAAREPEVVDLARCLSAMGARIEGAGSDAMRIEGVASLRGTAHRVMPDRIELGTYLAAAAAAGGKVRLTDAAPDSLDATLEKLRECGARIEVADRSVEIEMAARPKAVSLRTAPYPGFATDMQAQFMALASIASGTARITETIFENRFMHALELQRLGAQISIQGNTAVVRGVEPLLERVGIRPNDDPERSRKLVLATNRSDVQLIVVRASDTPTYVERGGADLGVAGRDVLAEHGGEGLYQPVDLGIAACRMMVAVRKGFDYAGAVRQGARLRVATKYVNITREHFAAKGVHVDLIRLYGSMELAPLVGLADAIVDLVATGRTLRDNGLVPVEEILPVSARLIVNQAALKTKRAALQPLIDAFARASR